MNLMKAFHRYNVCVFHSLPSTITQDLRIYDEITFDDGHYSIINNVHLLKYFKSKTVFIVPTLTPKYKPKRKMSYTSYYMDDAFINNNFEQFLSLEEIYILIEKYNFEVGMHSYYHDIVYSYGTSNNYRKWHLYKCQKSYYSTIKKIFKISSKLSIVGIDNLYNIENIKNRLYTEYIEYIEEDTYKCCEWFKKYLPSTKKYAFPFFEYNYELINTLYKYGINDLYGPRVEIR